MSIYVSTIKLLHTKHIMTNIIVKFLQNEGLCAKFSNKLYKIHLSFRYFFGTFKLINFFGLIWTTFHNVFYDP